MLASLDDSSELAIVEANPPLQTRSQLLSRSRILSRLIKGIYQAESREGALSNNLICLFHLLYQPMDKRSGRLNLPSPAAFRGAK